jgi:hypothetical protein
MTKKEINGPINIARLEGVVNGIKKIIYLFMDRHEPEEEQTKCDSDDALEIGEYFKKSFSRLENEHRMYDFFLEIPLSFYSVDLDKLNMRHRYIDNLMKHFKKWSMSGLKNIRLHYLDVRDRINYFFEYIDGGYKYWMYESYENHTKESINKSVSYLLFIKSEINFINENLKLYSYGQNDPDDKKINMFKELPDYSQNELIFSDKFKNDLRYESKYIIKKLLTKYKHNNIKTILNKLVTDNIIPHLDFLIQKLDETYKQITNDLNNQFNGIEIIDDNNILNEIYLKIIPLIGDCRDSMVFVMDLYFMRRFLDKDYITNGISYTGVTHSLNYIYFLVKLFDFKITHVSHAVTNNMEELNNTIKKYKNIFNVEKTSIPDIFLSNIQCSNISDFPDNFN